MLDSHKRWADLIDSDEEDRFFDQLNQLTVRSILENAGFCKSIVASTKQ